MKGKLQTAATLVLAALSMGAYADVGFWANKGVEYDAIIVKLKPEGDGNNRLRAVMQNHQLLVGSAVLPVIPVFDTEKKRRENRALAERWDKKSGFNRYFKIPLSSLQATDPDYINQLLEKFLTKIM
ncbi:hypothetical protein [Serratia proteamaculans]|uniref:Uncharacterized protein n=1 Tax=Serratia proteamaculans TaxID=28151 RepID=A0A5Q2V929_SERPR|nr:hypothetical protein [Serratia proteamaculans]QGH62012.1 hypothetical protein GHV41_14775 [Serratia proteamaculans]